MTDHFKNLILMIEDKFKIENIFKLLSKIVLIIIILGALYLFLSYKKNFLPIKEKKTKEIPNPVFRKLE